MTKQNITLLVTLCCSRASVVAGWGGVTLIQTYGGAARGSLEVMGVSESVGRKKTCAYVRRELLCCRVEGCRQAKILVNTRPLPSCRDAPALRTLHSKKQHTLQQGSGCTVDTAVGNTHFFGVMFHFEFDGVWGRVSVLVWRTTTQIVARGNKNKQARRSTSLVTAD